MRKYIILLLLAICIQLSADVLGKETLIKGTAKLNGKDVPMWFNVTAEGVVEVGNGKNAAISQYSEGELVVPANVVNPADKRSYKVAKVANFAFSLCSKLTTVTLEEGIKEIGENAFSGCNALQAIGNPSSLTAIGRGAFAGCSQLRHAQLPKNLASIGQEAFAGNQFADNKVILPIKLAAIPVAAFDGCKLQMAILPPTLKSIEEDAFRGTGSCDFYMFDGNAVPSVHNKGVNVASHWYVSKPQNYVQKSYCNGLLPISAMVPQDEFVADNLTYRIVQVAQYPGIFTASAYKRNDKKDWSSEFKDLKTAAHNPTFAGKWDPEYRINGIDANFFTGNDIVKLHHIALPASIEPAQSTNAFAQCKALVSLDLSAMSPLSKAESDALLSGLPEFTIVYAPKTQAQEHRAANTVLTNKDGKRHTSLYKMQLDENFDALALQGNLAYRLPYSFEAKRATFFRSSFKNKKKETLVLPFAAKPRGKAFAFDGMDKQSGTNTTLKFAKKDELQANTPYIYASDGTEIWAENVVVNPQNNTNTQTKDGLFGVYKADFVKALAAAQQLNGAAYTLNAEGNKGNATFVQATDEAKLTPFHAFLHLSDKLVGANLKLLFEGETATGIEKVTTDADNEDNTWYNLQGIKYNSKPQKGIYIRNGKKVVVQ